MTRSSTAGLPPNERLRTARLRRLSPSGSGRPMSRQDLADLVNAQLAAQGVKHAPLDAGYVGKLERGTHRWPQRAYRDAFREVLGAVSDADLGFYVRRQATAVSQPCPLMDERTVESQPVPVATLVALLTSFATKSPVAQRRA